VQEKKNAALKVGLFVIWELQAHLVRVNADEPRKVSHREGVR